MTVAPDRRKVVWSLACLFDMPLLLEVEDCSDLSFVSGFTNLGEVLVFFGAKSWFLSKACSVNILGACLQVGQSCNAQCFFSRL